MTKTLFRGNEIAVRQKAANAGYAIFVATGLLCILSFLSMSVIALGRAKIDSLEKQTARFYARLDEQNDSILTEWKNLEKTVCEEDEISFEID